VKSKGKNPQAVNFTFRCKSWSENKRSWNRQTEYSANFNIVY